MLGLWRRCATTTVHEGSRLRGTVDGTDIRSLTLQLGLLLVFVALEPEPGLAPELVQQQVRVLVDTGALPGVTSAERDPLGLTALLAVAVCCCWEMFT